MSKPTLYKVTKTNRKRWEVRIDGTLAASGRNLEELEAQIRIIKMLSDMNERTGTLKAYLPDGT